MRRHVEPHHAVVERDGIRRGLLVEPHGGGRSHREAEPRAPPSAAASVGFSTRTTMPSPCSAGLQRREHELAGLQRQQRTTRGEQRLRAAEHAPEAELGVAGGRRIGSPPRSDEPRLERSGHCAPATGIGGPAGIGRVRRSIAREPADGAQQRDRRSCRRP